MFKVGTTTSFGGETVHTFRATFNAHTLLTSSAAVAPTADGHSSLLVRFILACCYNDVG